MAPRHAVALLSVLFFGNVIAATPPWDDLPPGEGRELTYALCSGCHSMMLVKQQGLSREGWEDTLDWMIAEQGMPEPEPALREQLLNYLATVFSPERPFFDPETDDLTVPRVP